MFEVIGLQSNLLVDGTRLGLREMIVDRRINRLDIMAPKHQVDVPLHGIRIPLYVSSKKWARSFL